MGKIKQRKRHYFKHDQEKLLDGLGRKSLVETLKKMLLIRNFESRAELAYGQGKIGGFFHAYTGQEAIQTAAVEAMGRDNWWIASYRCHAIALLLGATVDELMAELYGRVNGNAMGRGGSMHLYTDRLLGGFGIVAGQIPAATGAAFALKYQENDAQVAICFLGDGAVAQGAFHESLNIASLWNLPCIYVIENNRWGMGTAVEKAICVPHLAEDIAPSYNMEAYSLDGMNYFNCYAAFQQIYKDVLKTGRPVLVEAVCERFKGHSISDPGLYREKKEVKELMARDPLILLQQVLIQAKMITEKTYKELDKEMKDKVLNAMKHAEESPWPNPITLEEDVFAPEAGS